MMRVIKLATLREPENSGFARSVVLTGGVVVYPTDTLYGLGGNFFDPRVSPRIDRIKQRADMPYSVVVAHREMLNALVDHVPEIFELLFEKLLPGKFTFLFPVSPRVAPELVKGSTKIGIRIPAAPQLLQWVAELGVPLISTSVNLTGQPPLNDPATIQGSFAHLSAEEGIALLLDGGAMPPSPGSTILDLTQEPIQCLRVGAEAERVKLASLGIPIHC